MPSKYTRQERRKAYFAIYKKIRVKESIVKTFIRWFKVKFKDPYKYELKYLAINKKESEYKWVNSVNHSSSMHHKKAQRIIEQLNDIDLRVGMIKNNGKEWGLI